MKASVAVLPMLLVILAACSPVAQEPGPSPGEDAQPAPGEGAGRESSPGPVATGRRAGAAEPRRLLLRFAVIGDFGAGTSAERAVARRMCAVHDRRRFPVVFTTGDNIYPSGQASLFEENFIAPFACLFDRGVRWHASLGNHDVATAGGRAELREPAFGMRGDHYVVRRNGVRFVVANSNALDGEWLQGALRSRAPDRWTVVVFHHPVYSPGPHGSTPGLSLQLPALLRRWGVDLVLNGHDHLYSATKPLGGIRYVVSGGGGAALYDCSPAWFVDVCLEEHHFLLVDALSDRLTVRAIGIGGEVLHSFSTPGVSPL